MELPANRHRRRSIRLAGYDYARTGAYFVTVCTTNRECLFGEIAGEEMLSNPLGKIVDDEWWASAALRDEISLDLWIVMPNHVHGIVIIETTGGGDRPVAPTNGAWVAPTNARCVAHANGPRPRSLGAFIAGFKAAVTSRINRLRGTPGAPVWQRNYYEHIVRDETDLARARRYIENNPARWGNP